MNPKRWTTTRTIFRHAPVLAMSLSFLNGCDLGKHESFISVQDTYLVEGSEPYYFAGTNLWYGPYLGLPGRSGDRDRLHRELDALRELGIDNLRVLGGSEQPYMAGMLTPSTQTAPGIYNEELLRGLDYLLAEMQKRRMRAVIFFTNYWEWSGGMSQYVVWANGMLKGPDPADPTFDWADFMDFSARFYQDSTAQTMYRQYIRHLVTRRNTVNGRLYTEDPTIMAWELANEPRPGTVSPVGESNLQSYYAWIDTTARFIKSIDQNHLVTTGSEGIIGSLVSGQNFIEAHSSPAIDYLTVHVWPYNWKWFDPLDIAGTIDSAEIKASAYILEHFALARVLNKPLVLEEFGLARDSAFVEPTSQVTARNRYFQHILGMVFDSAAAGAPIAGTNFWAWSGEGIGQHEDGTWRPGDPLLGDPPHEPQGINSVFLSDAGTISLLRDHAARMSQLRSVRPMPGATRSEPNAPQ